MSYAKGFYIIDLPANLVFSMDKNTLNYIVFTCKDLFGFSFIFQNKTIFDLNNLTLT